MAFTHTCSMQMLVRTHKLQLHPLDAFMFLTSGKNENLKKDKICSFFHKHIFSLSLTTKANGTKAICNIQKHLHKQLRDLFHISLT